MLQYWYSRVRRFGTRRTNNHYSYSNRINSPSARHFASALSLHRHSHLSCPARDHDIACTHDLGFDEVRPRTPSRQANDLIGCPYPGRHNRQFLFHVRIPRPGNRRAYQRTQEYIKALAKHLQKHPKFKAILTNETIELLFKAAPLHDIGKIGIRDHILLKPARLDHDEFEIMKLHPQIGADIIQSVATQIGWNPFMETARQICLYHQEKWDGSGYPQGIAGEEIPLSARLMALADVYDALISKRVYKPAFPHAFAVGIIREGKNSHFDPLVVEAFESIHGQFQEIAFHFSDDDDHKKSLLADHNKPY